MEKNLYWGITKLEINCVLIQLFNMEYFEALDSNIMMDAINHIIPNIKLCKPKDIRLSHAINQKIAFENASKLLNEKVFSESSLIYGEMGVGFDEVQIYFALSLYISGGRKDLVTIMKKSTNWSETLTVK
jgi:hypothetical protein